MPRLKYYNQTTEQWEYVVVGAQGDVGPTGPANTLTVGTVVDSAPGSEPEVTITGTAPNQTINFVLPTGATGETGETGETGNTGVVQQSGTPSSTDVLWLDTDEVADVPVPNGGTTGQVLAKSSNDDYDTEWAAPSGLVHIRTENVSAVTAISLNNIFSSVYKSYKVVVTGSAAVRTPLYIRLRANGVDATGSNYVSNGAYRDQLGFASFTETATNTYAGYMETGMSVCSFDVGNPFETTNTAIAVVASGIGANGILWLNSAGHNLSNSYDGMTLSTNSNFTGQINIYGYRN